jgi:splicing factor 3B subunit 2
LSAFVSPSCVIQRKANGVDLSIDVTELENMSEEQLRRRYDSASRSSAGVPGAHDQEDFSDMVAKEMAGRQKKQKMLDNKKSSSSKEFKF